MLAALTASGSQSATMFSEAQPWMSDAARPPAPIAAMFSFSFGDLYPSAPSPGVLLQPPRGIAPASSDPKKKCRRDRPFSDMVNLFRALPAQILPRVNLGEFYQMAEAYALRLRHLQRCNG